MKQQEVAELLLMHVNTVAKVLKRFRNGQPLVVTARRARQALLSIEDLAALRDMVIADDTLYLDELRVKLAAVRGKSVSRRTVLRGLCQLRLNRKRVRARPGDGC
jgi:transposase